MPIRVQTPDGITEFPDGTTPEEIDQILGVEPVDSKPERTWTDTAVDALPFVGGAIGGIVGAPTGPGAIGAAALGAAGGEGWRQVINRVRGKGGPVTMTEAAGNIATEGAVSGASQAAGLGLAKGGRAVYRGLLKPSKALRDSFGGADIVDTLVREGAPISDGGVKKIGGLLRTSRDKALSMVDAADPTSTLVQPSEVIGKFRPVVDTLRKRADIGQPDELAKVGARGRRIVQTMQRGAGVGAKRAQELKETAQDAASGAYRMMERGGAKQLGADDLLDQKVAEGLREAVEQRVPGIKAQNARTQELLGGTRALEDAVERGRNNLAVGGARDLIAAGVGAGVGSASGGGKEGAAGGAVTAGLLMRLLSSPRSGSLAAIGADRLSKVTPDALRALAAFMSSHEE